MRTRDYAAAALCFLLSGFAALLYETVWMRQLAVAFGTSELATVTVLAAFMGGLAAGSWLGELIASRINHCLRAYAVLELLIGLSALAVGPLLAGCSWLQLAWLGGQPEPAAAGGLGLPLLYFACGCLVLGLPTLGMGATLPLLARAVVRSSAEISGRVGSLYSLNLAGAVLGTLTAAFLWLPHLGLVGTVRIGVLANLVAAALALVLPAAREESPPDQTGAVERGLLTLIFLSGFTGLAYEVVWTRLLAQIIGSSLAAFSVMLAACLAGLSIGSAAAARWAQSPGQGWLGLAATQMGAAALFTFAFWRLGRVGFLEVWADRESWAIGLALAGVLLLPPYLCLGAAFTFAVRIGAREPGQVSHASGLVYRWNTLGAIVGTVMAGFILLPRGGFQGSLLILVGLNLLAALVGSIRSGSRPGMLAGAALVCLVGPLAAMGIRGTDISELLRQVPGGGRASGEIVYVAIGQSSSVLVTREWGSFTLRTNGLGEAGARLRGAPQVPSSQQWLGILPFMLRPDSRSVLVVGLGLGEALEGLPPGVQDVDVVELEPEVVRANQILEPLRRAPAHPARKARIIVNDARSALGLTCKSYDVVIAQASHPGTAGASHLYTREFVALVRGHLNPGGVYLQWMGLQAVDEFRLRSLAATLLAEFPHVALFEPMPGLPLFVSSDQRLDSAVGLSVDLLAVRRLDEAGVRELARGGQLNTDDRNVFAVGPRLVAPLGVEGFADLVRGLAAPYPAGVDLPYLCQRLVYLGFVEAASQLAGSVSNPLARARTLWAQGDQVGALATLRTDVSQAARFLRLKPTLWPSGEAREPSVRGFDPEYARVVAAAGSAARGDWAQVRSADQALSRLRPAHLAFETAAQLRAGWRMESGQAHEALELLDETLRYYWDPYTLALRAQAARSLEDRPAQWESLRDLVGLLWWATERRPSGGGQLATWARANLPLGDYEGISAHLQGLLKANRVR